MSIEKAFSRAAKSYRSHASIQARVAADLIALCGPLTNQSEAIDLGCGSGVLASLILAKEPELQLDCLDSSAAMVTELQSSLSAQGLRPRRTIIADARHHREGRYPLVLSSSALQWMEPLSETLENWHALCAPGATLAVACMVRGTLQELHRLRICEAPSVPPLRELPSGSAVRDAALAAAFHSIRFEEREYRLELTSAIDLYRSLTLTGTAAGPFSRGARLLNVSELRRIARRYAIDYPTDSHGVYATYRVAFMIAKSR